MKHFIGPLLLFGAISSASAQTTVNVAGGRLTLGTNNTDQNVKVEMKEAEGVARVFGLQGITDGTNYSGISAVTVNTGTGNDQVGFDIESRQSRDIRSNTRAGNLQSRTQWKILGNSRPVSARVAYTGLPAPSSLVEVDIDNETANSTINVDTGNASVVNGLTLDGGAGNDFLSNATKGVFQLSQTIGANINAGAGDDRVILTTDTSIRGTGMPNDITPNIDCGTGSDLYNAFGFINNCELRF